MNRELPIIMGQHDVRAILEGRKTVTRRVINRVTGLGRVTDFSSSTTAGYDWQFRDRRGRLHDLRDAGLRERCPYGKVGDRLWVRETLRIIEKLDHGRARAVYEADQTYATIHGLESLKPIADGRCVPNGCHREAARIWLEVTAVRVERLQDITEDEAEAEGVAPGFLCEDNVVRAAPRYVNGFRMLWDGLAKPGARWADNPWVWVMEFRRVER